MVIVLRRDQCLRVDRLVGVLLNEISFPPCPYPVQVLQINKIVYDVINPLQPEYLMTFSDEFSVALVVESLLLDVPTVL